MITRLTYLQLHLKHILLLGLILLGLGACDQSRPCIDGDDFGLPKITLDAQGNDVEGQDANQVSGWVDANLVLTGGNILFQVYGKWFPWFTGDESLVTNACNYESVQNTVDPSDTSCTQVTMDNRPCWLTKGMGIYGLAINATDPVNKDFSPISDPNGSSGAKGNPENAFGEEVATTFHLGDTAALDVDFDPMRDPGGGITANLPSELGNGKANKGDRLYFKILDTYYDDNGGSVVVKVRSGAVDPTPGFIETIITETTDILIGAAQVIFNGIVNSTFKDALRALLVLYVAFTGLMYVMGLVEQGTTHRQLLIRSLKIGLIVILMSNTAWEFFYNNLFRLFTDGMLEIISLISQPLSMGMGTPELGGKLVFFDQLFNMLTSDELHAKIWSLMFGHDDSDWFIGIDPEGLFLYIPMIYVIILFLMIAIFKAVLLYLMVLISIAMLIAIGPIFICFLLFEKTKKLFDEYLKQLVTSAMQPILLFAFLMLLYVIIMQQLYAVLGYTVCWDMWWSGGLWPGTPTIDINGVDEFMYYLPSIRNKWDVIWIPPFYNLSGNDVSDIFMNITNLQECRLVDYPGLDPAIYSDKLPAIPTTCPYETDIISSELPNGTVTSITDMFVFAVLVYLMFKFSDLVPALARELGGLAHSASFEKAGFGKASAMSLGGIMDRIGKLPLKGLKAAGSSIEHGIGTHLLPKKMRPTISQDRKGLTATGNEAPLQGGLKHGFQDLMGLPGDAMHRLGRKINLVGKAKKGISESKLGTGIKSTYKEGKNFKHKVQDKVSKPFAAAGAVTELPELPGKAAHKAIELSVKAITEVPQLPLTAARSLIDKARDGHTERKEIEELTKKAIAERNKIATEIGTLQAQLDVLKRANNPSDAQRIHVLETRISQLKKDLE